MTSISVEEKYNWLLKQLKVTSVDFWEQDALVELKHSIYFQFSINENTITEEKEKEIYDVDKAIEHAMRGEL